MFLTFFKITKKLATMKNLKSVFSKLLSVAAAGAVLSFGGCKDDDHHGNTAVITFTSPAEHATFSNGDTVHVEGTAAAEEDLHGYELYILNKTAGDTVLFFSSPHHGTTITVDTFWVVGVIAASDMELGITVILDHQENRQTEKVDFHCTP